MIGWYQDRFREEPRRTRQDCRACGRPMWLPKSKLHWHTHCSMDCLKVTNAADREALRRDCETCGASFIPRPRQIRMGWGRFCSQRCNTAGREALCRPEVIAKAADRLRAMNAAGLVPHHTGPANPCWKGGKAAAYRRAVESGRSAAQTRAYRRKNPEKVREFAMHRRGLPRLPWGTIPRIAKAQRWRCAICAKGIKRRYHLDHIEPLARGGKHLPRNLQLLCPTCNVRKNAKDPIVYMREIGRLL